MKYTYRIKQTPVNTSYCFMDWERAKNKFDLHDYVYVWYGEIEADTENVALEKLFVQFNTNHPHNYYARSLSVSDVVIIDDGHNCNTYYCDDIGWELVMEERN